MIALLHLVPQVAVRRDGDRLVVDNGKIRLTLDAKSGLYDVAWGDAASIDAAAGEVRLADGRLLKTGDYPRHDASIRKIEDRWGTGTQVTVRHRKPGTPELRPCDVFANIGASEYLLNSTNYGWWPGGRLYAYNDPDSACVYQPMDEPPVTEAEARTRFTASAISGGMMIQGDDLTKPEARERVERLFSNPEILSLARRTPGFWPVDGATGTKGGDAFV